MKRGLIASLVIITILMSFSALAAICDLDVSLLNQDPYPGVPGDYVEVVFQVSGVENPECGQVSFSLLEKYPIHFDPGTESSITISAGTFTKDYSSFLMVPYKIRIDENALDGDNPIEVSFSNTEGGDKSGKSKQFNINIENVKADFEIFVKDYDKSTNNLIFEILNIAESDVEALTLEIPSQEQITVKGPKRNIVGDLDSNEYTTAEFEAVPENGEIKVDIFYTDTNGVRRNLTKTVLFESAYFEGRKADENKSSTKYYIIGLILIVIIGYIIYRRRKAQQRHK